MTNDPRAAAFEEAARVAESEIGILSPYRSGGSFGAARADQGRVIAAAIRALATPPQSQEPSDDR